MTIVHTHTHTHTHTHVYIYIYIYIYLHIYRERGRWAHSPEKYRTEVNSTKTETSNDCNVNWKKGGARGVMVIVVGNEHGDMSSNLGRD